MREELKLDNSHDSVTVRIGLSAPWGHLLDLSPVTSITWLHIPVCFPLSHPLIYCLSKSNQQDQSQIIFLLWSFFWISLPPAVIFSSMKTQSDYHHKYLFIVLLRRINKYNIYLWALTMCVHTHTHTHTHTHYGLLNLLYSNCLIHFHILHTSSILIGPALLGTEQKMIIKNCNSFTWD